MAQKMFANWHAYAALPLRFVLGIAFMVHGTQKLVGWFGGPGLAGAAEFLALLGFVPGTLWAVVAGLVELIGGAAILAGVLTRWVALALALRTLVALVAVQAAGVALPGAIEARFLLMGALIALACTGPQRFAAEVYAPRIARYDEPIETRRAA